jgi:hypothetical protein
MIRVVLVVGLLSLLGGCNKKRKAAPEADPPAGQPSVTISGGEPKPVQLPVVAARPRLPEGWVEFRQPEGVFAAYLPNPAQPIKFGGKGLSLRQPVPQGRVLMADYGTNKADPQLYCEVGVAIYSPELVDGVKAAEERRGPVLPGQTKRTAVTWCGHPAFEDSGEEPERQTVCVSRRVWIGNRSYYCSLFGRVPGRPTAEERAAAFDSFTPEK